MARFSLSPPPPKEQTAAASLEASATSAAVNITKTSPPTKWKWVFPPQDPYYEDTQYKSYQCGVDEETTTDDDSSCSSPSEEEGIENDFHDDAAITDGSDDEEEPPHPLGFTQRYGKTRFGPSIWQAVPPRSDIFNKEDDTAWNTLICIGSGGRYQGSDSRLLQQSFPPIEGGYYLSNDCGVSTNRLIRGAVAATVDANKAASAEDEMKEILLGMDRIANLVRAANYVKQLNNQSSPQYSYSPLSSSSLATTAAVTSSPYAQPRSTSKLLQLAQACEQYHNSTLANQMSQIYTKRSRQYQQSHDTIQQLIQADLSTANMAQNRIEIRQKLRDQHEIEQREKQQKEKQMAESQRQREIEEQRRLDEEESALLEEERYKEMKRQEQCKLVEEEVERATKTKFAHVDRAQSLISNLDTVRSSLVEFDNSKSVSKRRLQFKKVVNGKINTLSHEVHKILDVARIVGETIVAASRDDDDAASAGGGGVMTMGKKYLLDLLASNLIVRVQAGTFNGVRGDGFPLASMFAHVSTQCEELGPLLEAHLYGVCPTAIPTMSLTSAGGGGEEGGEEDEEELMESLGMIRDKEGKFESFDKFLNRTEVSAFVLFALFLCAVFRSYQYRSQNQSSVN